MRRGKGLQRTAFRRKRVPFIARRFKWFSADDKPYPPKPMSPQQQRRAEDRREWAKAKAEHLRRTPWCEVGPRPHDSQASNDVHHILTQGQGGGHEWKNLLTVCRYHHDKIHHDAEFKREAKRRGWIIGREAYVRS